MIDVGMKNTTPGADALELVDKPGAIKAPQMMRSKRPERMPHLPPGHVLFGSIDQGFGEHLYLCETLEDAQYLWDRQDVCLASPIWYSAPVLFAEDN